MKITEEIKKANKEKTITRSYPAEFRASEEEEKKGNTIVGMPIVFDKKTNLGFFEEVIERGALDEADLNDVLFFVNHDTSKIPLARSKKKNKESTMSMEITDEGLKIEAKLDTENNSDARNLYSAVSRGDIDGMSFMFRIDDEEWENLESDLPLRRIKKIAVVHEVSAVSFPAYEATSIDARNLLVDANKKTVDAARAKVVDATNTNDSLELEKLKIKLLYGGK